MFGRFVEKGNDTGQSVIAATVRQRGRSILGVLLAGALAVSLCETSHAAAYLATGTIVRLSTYDLTWFGANTDFFSLSGATSMGTCGLSDGYVAFRLHDDVRGQRMFAGLTAAQIAGNTVTAYVDDQYKDSTGFCYAITITFGPVL